MNNIIGSGYYEGTGVSSGGNFDPGSAGQGMHLIRYIFQPLNGCTDTISSYINVYSVPTVDIGRDTTILEGGQIKLKIITAGDSLTYKWSPSIGLDNDEIANPIASPSSNITYKVVVSNNQGCVATDEIIVRVLSSPPIPNTFTPNSDGINDRWNLKYVNSYPDAILKIFNRYGTEVFTTRNFTEGWDGQSNGKPLPSGTYYYLINPNNGRKAIAGAVTIIR